MAEKSDKNLQGAPELPKDVAKQLDHDHSATATKSEKEATPLILTPENTDAEPASPDSKNDTLEDKKTDEAVDDIIRSESDELLEARDEATPHIKPAEQKPRWWRRRWLKWLLVLLLLAGISVMIVPTTRYWILNTAGVRASASVAVIDETTGQPLKNVTVTIGNSQAKTGSDGKVKVERIKLGDNELKLERIAFASLERKLVIGWGSNPLGTIELDPVGAQYTLVVRDYLANKPIEGAEASSGQAAALSDKDGKIVLTLEKSDGSDVTAKVSAPGYRTEQMTLSADTAVPNNVVLVPSTKEVFVSKESGKYDVYTIDIDGKNKKVLLAGTGLETGNIGLSVSPDGERAALVSTRDNVRAADGKLLNTLTLIDVTNGETWGLDRGEQIQLIDWIGNRIVYQIVANVAADAADRQRIVSYDTKTQSRALIASANQIRSAASAQGAIYYATTDNYYRVNPDGAHKQSVLNKEVWVSYRTNFNELSLQTNEGWYRLNLKTGAAAQVAEPSSYASRTFVTNNAAQQSLWIDKNSLQVYTVDTDKTAVLHSQDGLAYPVRWLTDTVAIFRITGQEVADYVVSTQGGAARKITGVIGTFGINPAY